MIDAGPSSTAEVSSAPTEGVSSYYLDDRPDIRALIDVAGKRILDVGCGGGALGLSLRAAGAAAVIGIERVPEVAALARRRLDAVVTADVETSALPFKDSEFDYIVFADVLEHVVDPWSVLRGFGRYLARDGRVVASIPNLRFYAVIVRLLLDRWDYRDSGILDRTHLRFFTRRTIRRMFADAGYRIERLEPKFRLFEDQSRIGRVGALASRWFCRFLAPFLAPHLFAFQYLIVARRSA